MPDRFEDAWLEYLSSNSPHRPETGGEFEFDEMFNRQKPGEEQVLTNLEQEFKELISNKQELRTASENFLNNIIDELTLGIIFDYHRKYKTNAFDLDAKNCASGTEINEDIFTHANLKKTQDCICPICDKSVGASRFAPHLEKCMGMGRSRSRNARRMVTNTSTKEKDNNNSNYAELVSDDEDADWNPRDKRRKKKDRNGKKKTKGGTPKKGGDPEANDHVNIDVEGDEDDINGLRDLLQDHSNSSSPAESVASSHSSSTKRRDRSKNKKNRRDKSPASLD